MLMAHQGDLLVEYDMATASPVGVVAFLKGRPFELVNAQGGKPSAVDGSDVAAVVLTDSETGEVTRLERNACGSFYQVCMPEQLAAVLMVWALAQLAGSVLAWCCMC
jgi:hypothetical protein